MKLVIFAIFCAFTAKAATIEVVGVVQEPILSVKHDVDLSKSVGQLTVDELTSAKIFFEGDAGDIASIAGLKNEVKVISDKEMRAYGWCYSVNGEAPDLMPDKVFLASQNDDLRWFYAYSEYVNDKWISQCVPVVKPTK